MSKAEQPVRTTLTERVQVWADGDRVERMLDALETYQKGHSVEIQCKSCKKHQKHIVTVPDGPKILEGFLKVLEQIEGKPGTVDGEPGGVQIVVNRIWPSPDSAK